MARPPWLGARLGTPEQPPPAQAAKGRGGPPLTPRSYGLADPRRIDRPGRAVKGVARTCAFGRMQTGVFRGATGGNRTSRKVHPATAGSAGGNSEAKKDEHEQRLTAGVVDRRRTEGRDPQEKGPRGTATRSGGRKGL